MLISLPICLPIIVRKFTNTLRVLETTEATEVASILSLILCIIDEWAMRDLNSRPPACKAGTLTS